MIIPALESCLRIQNFKRQFSSLSILTHSLPRSPSTTSPLTPLTTNKPSPLAPLTSPLKTDRGIFAKPAGVKEAPSPFPRKVKSRFVKTQPAVWEQQENIKITKPVWVKKNWGRGSKGTKKVHLKILVFIFLAWALLKQLININLFKISPSLFVH